MKKGIFNFLKGALVLVLLLKLTFILDIPQKGTFSVFAIEMNEAESEESQKTDTDSADEFLETPFHWKHSNRSILLQGMLSFRPDAKGHIREVVPPPPQA